MEDNQSPAEQVVFDVADSTEAFADNLKRQCSPNYADVDLDRIYRVNQRINTVLRNQDDHEPQALDVASVEEVRELIKTAKVSKALGPDGSSNRTPKAVLNKAVVSLICDSVVFHSISSGNVWTL